MFERWLKRDATLNGHEHRSDAQLIDMRQIVKTFQSTAGSFTALKGVDLQIDRGEFVAIIGKSGSGKSTLINMLTGIDRPTSGEVLVGDTAVHTLSEGQMAVWRGRNVGVIFQFFQLLPSLSIVENVMLPMDFCHMYAPRARRARAMRLLEQVEMAHQANKLPSAVSGGQQQRVAIARALANDPPILVADEPTGNLDSKTANAVFKLFEGLVQQGKTVLMVTHDSDLARRVSRAIIVADGEIVNEYVARALSALSVDQLALVTQQLQARTYAPGAPIITQGEVADQFYIITKGQVDILLHHPDGQDIPVARLSTGQYFGEIGLLRGGVRTASVRAAGETSVDVVALDTVLRVPGVVGVESWNNYPARRLRPDESESNSIYVVSLPAKTIAFNPNIGTGRWLLPEDAQAVVVNTEVLKKEPDIRVGDDIVLKILGQETTLRVVGVTDMMVDAPMVYVNQSYFDRVVGQVGKASEVHVMTQQHDGAFQAQVAKLVEAQLKRDHLEIANIETATDRQARSGVGLTIIVVFLLMMAALLALLGGLGLMGTMSINVIERTREIGVMRAIGASDAAVLRIVIAEGILIGVLSWLIGALIAFPVSKLLSEGVGVIFGFTFHFAFSPVGVLLWLGIVVVLAAVASFLPAWSASRLTVRDVLAYE